jgi:protein O-mannosyl-transferase
MPPDTQDSRTTRWPIELVAAALLLGAVWLVYGRSLDAPFICDDSLSVVENDSIRHLWPPVGNAEHPGPLRPPQDAPTCGRTLVNWTLAANYAIGGLSPRGYRAFNIFLHALNVLLLAALLRRVLGLPYFEGRFAGVAGPLAFAVALLWALHPLVTETVVYVTQRTELMASFFYLATLYASLRYWENNGRGWLAAAVLACWAGMASKEIVATAPVMVLLFDRTFRSRSVRAAWQGSRPLYVGLFTSWLLLLCLAGPGPRAASAGFHLDVSATDWWLTQSRVLLMYLQLAVWPWPLSIHYELPYLTSLGEAWFYVVPVLVLVVATLVLLWRRSAAGYLLALALAVLAPTLIVPIVTEVAAERRMYLPLAALVVLVVAGGYVVLRRAFGLRAALACVVTAAALLAVAGGIVGAKRLVAFEDELTLWQDVLAHDPADAKAQYNVGTVYLDRKQPQRAVEYFERAIELQPDFAQAHHNLGAAFSTLGRPDEATKEFERAVALEPRYSLARVKLGITAMQAGELDAAEEHFLAALRANPNSAAAHSGFAGLLLEKGQLDDAIRHAQAALDAGPESAEAHNTLGAALAQQGQMAAAVEHFEAAVRLDPGLLLAQGNLAAAYASLGRLDDAHQAAAKALQIARERGDESMEARINALLEQLPSSSTELPPVPNDPPK